MEHLSPETITQLMLLGITVRQRAVGSVSFSHRRRELSWAYRTSPEGWWSSGPMSCDERHHGRNACAAVLRAAGLAARHMRVQRTKQRANGVYE